RVLRTIADLQEQYASFRADWELVNMIPFTKMLAERQGKLRDQSKQNAVQAAGPTETLQRQSMHRRQNKMVELVQLIQPAFTGLGMRMIAQEPILAKAFENGAATLKSNELQKPLRQAADDAQ